MNRVEIVITNSQQTHELCSGLGLQALAVQTPTALEFDCRQADCGICILRVLSGKANLSAKTAAEQDFLKAMHPDDDERLACQCRIFGDVTVAFDDP